MKILFKDVEEMRTRGAGKSKNHFKKTMLLYLDLLIPWPIYKENSTVKKNAG